MNVRQRRYVGLLPLSNAAAPICCTNDATKQGVSLASLFFCSTTTRVGTTDGPTGDNLPLPTTINDDAVARKTSYDGTGSKRGIGASFPLTKLWYWYWATAAAVATLTHLAGYAGGHY